LVPSVAQRGCCAAGAGNDDLYAIFDPLYLPPPFIEGRWMLPLYFWAMGVYKDNMTLMVTGNTEMTTVWSANYTLSASGPTPILLPTGVPRLAGVSNALPLSLSECSPYRPCHATALTCGAVWCAWRRCSQRPRELGLLLRRQAHRDERAGAQRDQ
jgi:hypothetical protein